MTPHLRRAYRRLRRTPGFTFAAVATLALCIGANLAIFAVVNAGLVRSLPFVSPDRLVVVFKSYPLGGVERAYNSIANYFDRRNAIKAFGSVAIYSSSSAVVGSSDSTQRVSTLHVSPEFFTTLGVRPALGRSFTETELSHGSDQVAVLSHGFWQSSFGADPRVLGRTFLSDGDPVTVIGVMPPEFRFLSERPAYYRPASHSPEDRLPVRRHANGWSMIARLAPAATLADAQAQIDALDRQQTADDSIIKGVGYRSTVRLLHADYVRSARAALLLLQGGCVFLLLIGLVNLASLLLIQASGRTREIAVQRALGAGGAHLAADILSESMALSVTGAALGILVGFCGVVWLRSFGADRLPLANELTFDFRIAGVALAAALVVGTVLALPNIWFALRGHLAAALQSGTRGSTGSRAAQRWRHGFTIAQISLAFVLLAGAGLLGVSLRRALKSPLGFQPDHVVTARLTLSGKRYANERERLAFVERVLAELRLLPGVVDAAINTGLPFTGGAINRGIAVEGYSSRPGASLHAHNLVAASGGYWRVMGIPVREGRPLQDSDNHRDQKVCVVDQLVARRYWPGASPLGQRLSIANEFTEREAFSVVGVVGAVKQDDVTGQVSPGVVYLPYAHQSVGSFSVVVRTSLSAGTTAQLLQKAIGRLDPELPIDELAAMEARVQATLLGRRASALLAAGFAGVALLLAAIGTYGVLAHAVALRRREIGLRIALGASPRHIQTQFLTLGVKLAGIGIPLGVMGASAAGLAMRSVLFEVGPLDVGVLAGAVALLSVTVLAAVWVPSRRAAGVDPIEALKAE